MVTYLGPRVHLAHLTGTQATVSAQGGAGGQAQTQTQTQTERESETVLHGPGQAHTSLYVD